MAKKKKDFSIIINIVFVALFIAACIFVYKIFGLRDINSLENKTAKIIQEKTEQQVQMPETPQVEQPKAELPPFKKYHYKVTYAVNIRGSVKNLEIKAPVATDEKEKQYITDFSMSIQPKRLYNDGVNTIAEYFFDSISDQNLIFTFEGNAEVRNYDIKTAEILDKNISPEKDLSKYLQPELYIESDDPFIKSIADKIGGNTTEEIVQNIYEYEQKNIKYTVIPGTLGAKKTLQAHAGKCSEFSAAMVALCRAKNIPARIVIGFFAREQDQPHDWVEVYYDKYGWVMYDPTAQPTIINHYDPNGRFIKKEVRYDLQKDINYISSGRNTFQPFYMTYSSPSGKSGSASMTRTVEIHPVD